MQHSLKVLNDTVVSGGYCIGCGACAAVEPTAISIGMDSYGMLQATVRDYSYETRESRATAVCPFSSSSATEDIIAEEHFGGLPHHPRIGRYNNCYAGHVTRASFRSAGSSGGVGKWLLAELLRGSHVDAVVHVVATERVKPTDPLYSYSIVTSSHDVIDGSKSVYYPVEMSKILDVIRQTPRTYAITGVPCFIKAIRLLSQEDIVFRNRIRFCIGIICGHLKSASYADMLAWQLGIKPADLQAIDFRAKFPGSKANEKGVVAIGTDGGQLINNRATVQKLFGTNYGHGLFKYKACDYCDDVIAETADVAIGDAWLPQYINDGQGTSIVVTRNQVIEQILSDGQQRGDLSLDEISPDDVARSQAAGLRHRREGLSYRLHLTDARGQWRPQKRVQASSAVLTPRAKKVQQLRIKMASMSHSLFLEAKRRNDFEFFRKKLCRAIVKHDHLSESVWRQAFRHRLANRLKKIVRSLRFGMYRPPTP